MSIQPVEQFSELRSIHETLVRMSDELPKGSISKQAVEQLRFELHYLATRLDREISVTPRYTGDGNAVIRDLIYQVANEMFGKFEALAGTLDPDYIDDMRRGFDDDGNPLASD